MAVTDSEGVDRDQGGVQHLGRHSTSLRIYEASSFVLSHVYVDIQCTRLIPRAKSSQQNSLI